MKKLYTLLAGIICCASLSSQTTDSKPTFTIVNLKAPTGDEGVVHTETKYNAEIEIKFRNVTQRQWDGIFLPPCLGEAEYDMSYVEMVSAKTSASNSTDHSYLEIKNIGEANIERVEFIAGAAAQAASLSCAPSVDGQYYMDEHYITATGKSLRKGITFAAPSGGEIVVCGNTYFYDIPESVTYEEFWGENKPDYPEFRKDAKYVRLNWGSKPFAGSGNPKGGTLNLMAIKIYTDADTTGTGIENDKQEKFGATVIGNRLMTSEIADIQIYSTQGNLVLILKNTEEADLSDLVKGIYIVKAKSVDKKQTIVKKIIL